MAQIRSNMFKFDFPINTKVVEEPTQLLDNKIDSTNNIERFNKSKSFLDTLSKVKHSCSANQVTNFVEVSIDSDTFEEHHYSLMKGKYIIVLYAKDTKTYKYLTQSGTVYITTDLKLVELVNSVPHPIKLTYDYVPKVSNENIMSFKCMCKVLYNITSSDPKELINQFIKKGVSANYENEYSTLMHLFMIYPKFERHITDFAYWKYIYTENNLYYLASQCINSIYEVDDDKFNSLFNRISEDLKNYISSIGISTTILTSPFKTLVFIKEKTDYLPTLDPYLLDKLGYEDMKGLMNSFYSYCTLRSIKDGKPIVSIDTHTNQGLIMASDLQIHDIYKDKKVIKATYGDLFFKILASITYNKELISLCKENYLINALLEESEYTTDLNLYYCNHYIKGLLQGITTEEVLMSYFQKSLKTVIYSDTFKLIENIYNKNLSKLKSIINEYNETKYSNHSINILQHKDTTNLNKIINDKHKLIMKDLILELDVYIQDFNKHNKNKIDIYYMQNDTIYLIVDEEAVSVAMDNLTRLMPLFFNKYCPSINPTCQIDIID